MKAKLVIEMPNYCEECQFCRSDYWCTILELDLHIPDATTCRLDICPLEPIIEPTKVHYTLKGPPFGDPSVGKMNCKDCPLESCSINCPFGRNK